MREKIAESDWKLFRRLRPIALERFCERALDRIERVRADSQKGFHARYLEVYRLVQQEDRELARAFNDVRRTTAIMRLATIRFQDLLTEEEFQQFGEETRRAVEDLLSFGR